MVVGAYRKPEATQSGIEGPSGGLRSAKAPIGRTMIALQPIMQTLMTENGDQQHPRSGRLTEIEEYQADISRVSQEGAV
jgi:hypothetical protein